MGEEVGVDVGVGEEVGVDVGVGEIAACVKAGGIGEDIGLGGIAVYVSVGAIAIWAEVVVSEGSCCIGVEGSGNLLLERSNEFTSEITIRVVPAIPAKILSVFPIVLDILALNSSNPPPRRAISTKIAPKTKAATKTF